MDVKAVNEDETDMPFGFAVHPYFSKRGDANRCFIKVPVRRHYEVDENLLPSGRLLDAADGFVIWDEFHSVESLDLDTVYRGMTGDMESLVRYHDVTVHIRGSDCFRNAVVFTPHNRNGFCIEPQTCATNFINLHARGFIDESGLLVLPAKKTFSCQVHMTVSQN
jgi:aldose 1-epimerase